MVFGLDVGFSYNTIYILCNQYYSYDCSSELNRIEFEKNIELFSRKVSSRQHLDSYIDGFGKEDFEETQYIPIESNENMNGNNVFKEFHDFIIYYIVSNKMDLGNNNLFLMIKLSVSKRIRYMT